MTWYEDLMGVLAILSCVSAGITVLLVLLDKKPPDWARYSISYRK